jgi:hypothetical protein
MMVTLLAALGCLSVPSMADLAAAPAATGADAVRTLGHVDSQPLQTLDKATLRHSPTGRAPTRAGPVRSVTLPELPGFFALATAVTALAGMHTRRKR